MRRVSIVSAFLAAFLVSAVALAASDKVVADFIAQASSGAKGQATLNALSQGGTMIHGKITGLEPNTAYISQYFTDGACSATPATEVARFRTNPQGAAQFSGKVAANLADIKSISVQLGSDMSLRACAVVTP
jgi:hypothetical protein